ncbi:GA module-containing protein [Listeria monocytogenes]
MKKSNAKSLPSYNEPKYRVKMYKKKKNWLVKGLFFSSLVLGGLVLSDTESAYADEWTANSVESIQAKLDANQSSYTFEKGDTFYNISLAVNVKWQKLMELNGFEDGSQYSVPIGTTISFDGLKVKITDSQGKIVSETKLTPADKVDPSQTFGKQVTDVPHVTKSSNSNTPNTSGNNAKVSGKDARNIQPLQSTTPENLSVSKEVIDNKKNELKNLEDQREALKAEKAELEKLKQEIEVLLTDNINQSNEWRFSTLNSQKSAITQNVNDLQNEIDNQRARLQAIDDELAQAQNTKNDIANQLSVATAVYQEAQQKIEELKATQSALESQLANLPEDQTEQRQALQSQLATVKATLEVADNSGSQLAELNEQLNQSDNRINQLMSEKEATQIELNQLQVELSQAQEQLNTLNSPDNEKSKTKQEALEKQQQLAAYGQEIDAINTQINQLDEKIATLITEIDTLEKNYSSEKNTLDNIQSTFLTDAKSVATTMINALPHLSLNEKEKFILQVEDATTNQQVLNVYSSAVKQDAENTAADAQTLADAKAAANTAINALPNLSGDEKTGFITQVDNAGTIAEVSQIQQEAQAKDTQNKASADAQALADAKNAANTVINALPNLSNDEKTGFINQVDNAGTIAEVSQIHQEAQAKDTQNKASADAQALADAKAAANTAINALPNLSADEKTGFINQVDSAGTIAEVSQIQQEAQTKDTQNKASADAQALADAKNAANTVINALPNLSADEKTGFIAQVDNAGTIADVTQAQQDAEARDAQALADAKAAANTAINALPNLSADEKTGFINQVDNAGTIAEVSQAQQDAEARNAQALADAKAAANTAINALPNLSNDEKTGFIAQVDNAGTIAEVTQAQQDAEARDTQALADAKAAANTAINALPNLSADEKTGFINQVDNAGTIAEVTQAQQDAEARDAQALADAKAAANTAINALPNLSNDEKTGFIAQVDNAGTIADVTQAQQDAEARDAQALADAKAAANTAINALPNLSADEKTGFITQVDNAGTIADVSHAQQDAEFTDFKNSVVTYIANVKTWFITPEQIAGYKEKINKANTMEEAIKAKEFITTSYFNDVRDWMMGSGLQNFLNYTVEDDAKLKLDAYSTTTIDEFIQMFAQRSRSNLIKVYPEITSGKRPIGNYGIFFNGNVAIFYYANILTKEEFNYWMDKLWHHPSLDAYEYQSDVARLIGLLTPERMAQAHWNEKEDFFF